VRNQDFACKVARRKNLAPNSPFCRGGLIVLEQTVRSRTPSDGNPLSRRRPAVVAIDGGKAAHLQLFLISLFEKTLRPLHHCGLWQATHFLTHFFSPGNAVFISDGSWKFKIYLSDGYWTRWIVDGFTYEDEIAKLLDRILNPRSVFIDCGANNGYWSLYAASRIGSNDRIVAIEAGEMNFRRLQENLELNGHSFRALRKAIFSQSNVNLQFRTHPLWHASNTCVFDAQGRRSHQYMSESVESITIDDVLKEIFLNDQTSEVIIKIDIEGCEIAALKGAAKLIADGALVIYEDHGSDRACEVTDHILREYGLDIYFLHRDGLLLSKVEDIAQLAALKSRPGRGYNLLAARPESRALGRLLNSVAEDEKRKG
jgi:FkbM family methyltransferase